MKIFITGSADGLGKMAAELLIKQGHEVTLHARNRQRGEEALKAVPVAKGVLTADLSSMAETKQLAEKANALGTFNAVIHNAGVGYQERNRVNTADGFPHVFAVNSLAPYILTALMHKPKRLVYLSSGLHTQGDATLNDLTWTERPWNGFQAYCDSKLHDAMLAFAVARLWPNVFSNAVEPGWVATKMGGPNATGDLSKGPETQAWLAVSEDAEAQQSGKYFFHQREKSPLRSALDITAQDLLLSKMQSLSGISIPV